jgi:hypothetical protein
MTDRNSSSKSSEPSNRAPRLLCTLLDGIRDFVRRLDAYLDRTVSQMGTLDINAGHCTEYHDIKRRCRLGSSRTPTTTEQD